MTKRPALVIDQERCIGCEACTVACRLENKTSERWIRVETENVNRKDIPEGSFPDLKMTFIPHLCNHCASPPCVETCPTEALFIREDGIVILQGDQCDGCQTCLEACPYGVILYSKEKDKSEKCNLCFHRIDQGLEPFCVICCEGQAIHYGDLNDPTSQVSRMISAKNAFQLRPERGTNPSLFYCLPRERREL